MRRAASRRSANAARSMTNDATDKDDVEATGPMAGERLAAARKDQDISIRDIAKELHLDEAKVQALEQNQFDVLGAPVFAKGHLRKYAEMVGVSEDDVLTDYYQLNRSAGAPPVVGPPRKTAREIDLSPWILPAVGVVIVLALLFWWLQSGSPVPGGGDADEQPDSASEAAVEMPVSVPAIAPATDQPDVEPGESVEPTEATEPEPDASAQPTAEEAAPAASPEPAVSATALALTLEFNGDCWTEVTDAAGERLFFDLGREGRTVQVSGEPPLRLLLGASSNVALTVNGESYVVPASALRGDTARFTLAGL